MKNRVFIAASIVLMIGLVLSGCGAPEAKVIKIATQGPLSGSMAVFGASIKDGTQLAIDQLSGPLVAMGFKVELAAFDDQGNPDTGVANAKSIVSDPAILAVVGHYNSGVQIPSSEEYHAAGLANVSPINTNPKVTDRGYLEVSRVCGRDDVQGAVGANFAAGKGIKSAYVIHDKTAYGQGIAEYFKRESEKLGIKILGFAGTEEKANFDSILSPILAAKPEVIYFGGIFDQGAVLFKQARQKGYMGMLLSDDAFDTAESAKIGGEALLQGAGTYFSTVAGPADAYPGTAKFQADFKAKFGGDLPPFAIQSYDAAAIVIKAIENAAVAAGKTIPARADVAKAVRALKDFPGVGGTINFNAKGDLVTAKYFMLKVSSADPAKWSQNTIDSVLDIAPPQ